MVNTVKALSLWQPWASLVATGAKTEETRGWSTKYRGPLLICAAQKKDLQSLKLLARPEFQLGLEPIAAVLGHGTVRPQDLPYGEAVALVNLTDCITTEDYLARSCEAEEWNEVELAFGDYSPGRFVWMLEDVIALPRGVRVRGYQTLWDQDMDEVLAVMTDQARDLYDHMLVNRIAHASHQAIAQQALIPGTKPLTGRQFLERERATHTPEQMAQDRLESGEGEL